MIKINKSYVEELIFPDIFKEAFISSYIDNKENNQLTKFNMELCGLKDNYLYSDEKIYRELCFREGE